MISVMFGSKAIFRFHRCRVVHKIVPFTTVLLVLFDTNVYDLATENFL